MRVISRIWGWIKSGVKKLVKILMDKGPVEVIEDATKAVVGVATAATVVYTGINAVKVMLMNGKKSKKDRDNKDGADYALENRSEGSVDEKLAKLRKANRELVSGDNLTNEDLVLLKQISKSRNEIFRSLSPEEQMSVLRMEGFDFEAFRKKMRQSKKRKGLFRKPGSRRVGERTRGKPFRTPVDYGWLNFIMRPLDDFICWLRNDPTPKKVKQIKLFDLSDLTNIQCESGEDAVQKIKELYPVTSGELDASLGIFENELERQICAEEIFRHKSLKSDRKAVNRRMSYDGRDLSSQLLDLMDDEKPKKKKKKGKKNKKKNKIRYYETDFDKKSKKASKKDKEDMSEYDLEAQKIMNHFFKASISGKPVRRGYRLDKLFEI